MARQTTMARFEVSGEILSEDTLALLAQPACKLAGAEMDAGDFAAAWELLSEQWQAVRSEVDKFDTERLRVRWIKHVLAVLDYQAEYVPSHPTYAERRTIPINYRSKELPFWLLDWKQKPDDKPETGARRISPHEHFQEYLDLTENDWGIICNGKVIRLLHDYHKTLTRNYVEADLESIFEALDVDAFRAVWRVFHASRFRGDSKGVLPIEKLRDYSRQEGSEIGKELRKQVLDAITTLGNGFIAVDRSGELLSALLAVPEAPSLFYQSLLRFVYRLLFLLYIENKPHWTPASDPIWASSYSISRLRERAEEVHTIRADSEDYWEGLRVVFGIIRDGCERFKIHPYGGELFNDGRLWLPLREASLQNGDLLYALRLLTMFERNKQTYRVNFRNLRIDALGSVYEALLDVAPVVTPDGRFSFAEGTDRKLTGSYYTPPELVAELIKSALVPVIEDRLNGVEGKGAQAAALLGVTVVDPACGSGAFLIQALDKLTEKLCEIRKEGEEPSELDIREARRDVVTHCIHGVDLNPMAVELCKFTLWLHVAHPKLPLSFLEPMIKCGNALVGVPLKSQVAASKEKLKEERAAIAAPYGGRLEAMPTKARKEYEARQYIGWPDAVPTEAFAPVTGDDKLVAKRIQESNKFDLQHNEQTEFDDILMIGRLAYRDREVRQMPEHTIDDTNCKILKYHEAAQNPEYLAAKLANDTWCAAFYWHLNQGREIAPITSRYKMILKNPLAGNGYVLAGVRDIARKQRFFHWEIEFPAVFEKNGFDCVLGNPPWERIKLQEQEFFASRDPRIARAANKTARERLIEELDASNPALYQSFLATKHEADGESKYLRVSGRFPLTAVGDINTYSVFSETGRSLLSNAGRVGIIVPTGIATDDTTKAFFSDLISSNSLCSLFGYENEGGLFPGVHHAFKFALITMCNRGAHVAELAFVCRNVADSYDSKRRFHFDANDFLSVSPNTRTCPVFRTKADADLTRAVHHRIPVLWHDSQKQNAWDCTFMSMFHMANDSKLFQTTYTKDRLPLYEAKMFHQFDHRWATYENATAAQLAMNTLPQPTLTQKSDSSYSILPRYWVDQLDVWEKVASIPEGLINAIREQNVEEVRHILGMADISYPSNLSDPDTLQRAFAFIQSRVPNWLLAFRSIARNIDQRTVIASVLPISAASGKCPIIITNSVSTASLLLANLNCIVMDYFARQKIGGTDLAFHYVKQFPVLPPLAYADRDIAYIISRVIELAYTSFDLALFAQELGFIGSPFIWDENRRAVLRAELDAYYARSTVSLASNFATSSIHTESAMPSSKISSIHGKTRRARDRICCPITRRPRSLGKLSVC